MAANKKKVTINSVSTLIYYFNRYLLNSDEKSFDSFLNKNAQEIEEVAESLNLDDIDTKSKKYAELLIYLANNEDNFEDKASILEYLSPLYDSLIAKSVYLGNDIDDLLTKTEQGKKTTKSTKNNQVKNDQINKLSTFLNTYQPTINSNKRLRKTGKSSRIWSFFKKVVAPALVTGVACAGVGVGLGLSGIVAGSSLLWSGSILATAITLGSIGFSAYLVLTPTITLIKNGFTRLHYNRMVRKNKYGTNLQIIQNSNEKNLANIDNLPVNKLIRKIQRTNEKIINGNRFVNYFRRNVNRNRLHALSKYYEELQGIKYTETDRGATEKLKNYIAKTIRNNVENQYKYSLIRDKKIVEDLDIFGKHDINVTNRRHVNKGKSHVYNRANSLFADIVINDHILGTKPNNKNNPIWPAEKINGLLGEMIKRNEKKSTKAKKVKEPKVKKLVEDTKETEENIETEENEEQAQNPTRTSGKGRRRSILGRKKQPKNLEEAEEDSQVQDPARRISGRGKRRSILGRKNDEPQTKQKDEEGSQVQNPAIISGSGSNKDLLKGKGKTPTQTPEKPKGSKTEEKTPTPPKAAPKLTPVQKELESRDFTKTDSYKSAINEILEAIKNDKSIEYSTYEKAIKNHVTFMVERSSKLTKTSIIEGIPGYCAKLKQQQEAAKAKKAAEEENKKRKQSEQAAAKLAQKQEGNFNKVMSAFKDDYAKLGDYNKTRFEGIVKNSLFNRTVTEAIEECKGYMTTFLLAEGKTHTQTQPEKSKRSKTEEKTPTQPKAPKLTKTQKRGFDAKDQKSAITEALNEIYAKIDSFDIGYKKSLEEQVSKRVETTDLTKKQIVNGAISSYKEAKQQEEARQQEEAKIQAEQVKDAENKNNERAKIDVAERDRFIRRLKNLGILRTKLITEFKQVFREEKQREDLLEEFRRIESSGSKDYESLETMAREMIKNNEDTLVDMYDPESGSYVGRAWIK